ncbi:FAD/NAD(P)-binding protein [Vibrio spartinae]|uniref:FAD-dependent urate hydroxylase HpyO/Asp monooxygenase CreE-like FAD/NAD(P)-binding domain-containing protein n=1 Tax=Vibrio spartinae TaxID=1918945 RepID=A0ABX6R488_9VIBR|nr:FAD/NAD(P)-binding protein [Vibrio spartinae]QMV16150.1 hypothetical protein Vspart_03535 [Vibrio spartinae]
MTIIAIVGAGAFGTYAMERLATLTWHEELDASALDIMLFERTNRFGDGEVYDVHQPKTNNLNTSAGELALGADDTVVEAKSLLLPEWNTSFYDWCRRKYEETGNPLYDIEESDAPPRAVYGEALKEALSHYINLIRNKGATVTKIPAEVIAIKPSKDRSFIITAELDYQDLLFHVDEILLVTGHARRSDTADNGQNYIANPYPVSHSCARIIVPPASHVGIRGMGLSSIDLILTLTEGRGGQFEPDDNSPRRTALKYLPSGDEPAKIVTTSRCGLFTRARSWLGAGNARLRTHPWYFTRKAIDRLRHTAYLNGSQGKIDANHWLMPLIVLEMAALFHAVTAGDVTKCPFAEGGNISKLYKDLLNGVPVEIQRIADQANFEAGSEILFRPEEFFDPLPYPSKKILDPTSALIKFIEFDNTQALLGATLSPYKAAAEGVWRDLRSIFSYAVDRGGLTPESHRDFVERLYRYHNHLSNGASLSAMEKILALLHAGMLDVSVSRNPVWAYDDKHNQWLATGPNETMRRVDTLIEANIPSIGQGDFESRLYQQMFRCKVLQRFENALGSESYIPGGVATDDKFHPCGAANPWRESMTVLGAQLDGAIFFQPSAAKVNCNDANLNKIAAWANGISVRTRFKEEFAS